MKVSIKTTNISLTPDIQDYLDKKLESLNKFLNTSGDTVKVDVELGKSTMHHQTGDIFRAEINIFEGKKGYRAVAERNDVISALDEMKDQILHSLRDDKTRRMTLMRRTGSRLKDFIRKFYKG